LTRFKAGQSVTYTTKNGLSHNTVYAMIEDADGAYWIGTYGGGLNRLKDGKFVRYTTKEGLFDDVIFQVLDDGRGYLWISCNQGVFRVSKQELNDLAAGRIAKLNSVSYDQSDGMVNAECNGGRMPAAIKTQDGKLWFPTMGGVAIVDPEAEVVNPNPPPVVIENVEIDRQQAPRPNPQSGIELKPEKVQLSDGLS